MARYSFPQLSIAALAVFAAAPALSQWKPPESPARVVVDTLHGQRLADPFQWLEDKTSPSVKAWTQTQHDATMRWMDANAPARADLTQDIARAVDRVITSAPYVTKGRTFFTRKGKGEAQAKLYTNVNGRDVVLFDPVALDPSGKTSISTYTDSPHDATVAVSVQRAGSEINNTHFVHRETGAAIVPPYEGITGVSFAATPGEIFFTMRTKALIDAQTPLQTYRLKLGAPLREAKQLTANEDAKNSVSVTEPERSRYTVYTSGSFWQRTIKTAPVGSAATPQVLFSSEKANANVTLVGDLAYIHTNDGAPNWKLERAPLRADAPAARQALLPERTYAVLAGAVVTHTHVIAREKRNLSHELRVYGLDGTPHASTPVLRPPEFGDVAGVRYDHQDDQLYVSLNTFNAPSTMYRVDAKTFQWTRIFQDESAIDTTQIETQRIDVPTRDGKRVPAFVSMKKGTVLDGKRPVVLYGYGGFNIGINVRYLATRAALINRGVIFVDAGIRGGNEFGEAWHADGMLANKQNTFNDFIDTAQWLITNRYTSPSKLAIWGGSNGGLLVGAAATQRPDLFKAAISSVPLLDMIRYHRFLIARFWIPEYGDPSKEADFRTLLTYSPYHNIRAGVELPTMLVIAGENDSRVDPLHAKKFVALAQNNVGQTNPVMLKMDFDSGHGSGKSTQQIIDDQSFIMRFLLAQIGD
jgi:prolyl oligopeptidase